MLVIAIVLAGFSAAIVYANQARLRSDIDRELRERALRAPPEGPPRMFPGPQGPGGRGPGPGNVDDLAPRQPGQGFPGREQLPPRFNDPAAIRFADVRRPRRFDRQGSPMGPMSDPPFDASALRSALTGESIFSNGEYDGEPIRIFTLPTRAQGSVIGAVQVARETRDVDQIWSTQLVTLMLFLPGALLAAALGAFFLTGRAMRPIAQMKLAAETISEQDLSRRLHIEGSDEFAELGQTFNGMITRLESAFFTLQSAYAELERAHETQKRFNADASHELRTPLTRLRLATSSALAEGATEEDRRRALLVADQASESMSRLVQEMLVLAKADAGQLRIAHERIDLRVVANDALEQFTAADVSIETAFQDSPVTVLGDRDHLSRVVTNLVENAIRHTQSSGKVTISVSSVPPSAVLRVVDTGEGVPSEALPHLAERFYRVDSARHASSGGTGLGLSICKTIVEAHGGTIAFGGRLGEGLTVEVRVPLAPK